MVSRLTHRAEIAGHPSREAYESLAAAAGLPLSQIVEMAEEGRLNEAARRAETRSATRRADAEYRARKMRLHEKRWHHARCELCGFGLDDPTKPCPACT